MAKADLRKPENRTSREQIGGVVQRAASLRGWNLQQLAAAVRRDERQVARWINGQERPQFDAMWDVDELRGPLVIAFAELNENEQIEVETTIRVRRSA